jgi:hypothetical protein
VRSPFSLLLLDLECSRATNDPRITSSELVMLDRGAEADDQASCDAEEATSESDAAAIAIADTADNLLLACGYTSMIPDVSCIDVTSAVLLLLVADLKRT